jgi:hypothetical protein
VREVLEKPNYARVRREVRHLHEEFGVTAPPVDPVRIARGIGVTVYFVIFETDKQNISGFFDYEERAIFVNRDEYPLRQTFTIAHELGHKILHEEGRPPHRHMPRMRAPGAGHARRADHGIWSERKLVIPQAGRMRTLLPSELPWRFLLLKEK